MLAELAESLANREIPVLISNHDTEIVRNLYVNASIESFFSVQRYISCNGKNRAKAAELLALFKPAQGG